MQQLKHVAQHAAHYRIRGRSYKRNSLLKPLDIILGELERCPTPTSAYGSDYDNEVEFACTSSKGLIYDHVKRIARGVHEEHIYQYVNLFFDEVLKEAHHGNINTLLQRERSLRSAYLVYLREALADLFVARGQATSNDQALQLMAATETKDDSEESGETE
jgi:hypothetical protein